jgi:hypothetical protein
MPHSVLMVHERTMGNATDAARLANSIYNEETEEGRSTK